MFKRKLTSYYIIVCSIEMVPNVYHEVPYEGQDLISLRWVCSLKHNDSGIILKARPVVKGFEDSEKDNIQKESPTCLRESLQIIISLSVQ